MAELTIRQERDPAVLAALHASLIVPLFPPEERGTAQELVASVGGGRSTVLVAAADGQGQPLQDAGLAVLETWPEVPDVTLLAWLAVSPRTRSRGTGSALLRSVLAQVGDRLLLAEIEPADTPVRHDDYGDPAARTAFYVRHGGRSLDLPYWQPPIRPGAPAVRLELIVIPQPGSSVPEELPAEPTRSFLATYALPHLSADLAEPLRQACASPILRTRRLG